MDPLLDTAPCGFLCIADDGRVLAANATFGRMVEASAAALVGRHVDVLLDAPGRIFYQTHVFPVLKLQGTAHEIYLSLATASGGTLPVLLNATRRARDGAFVNEVVVVPMRQRDAYENEILKARRIAEEAARAKDEFIAHVSHELRSPLSAISGWAHLLAEGRLDEPTRARALKAISENARAQARLVDDLLDFTRVSMGKLTLDLSPTALGPLVAAAVDSILPTAAAKGVELACSVDARDAIISGDAKRLPQILWNILANAVKFTPAGGRVRLALKRRDSIVEIAVTDTGRGIEPAFLPYVFDRFQQEGRAGTRSESGLGLGMAITRHLVELHAGSISAESEGAGRGATFRVRFPLLAGGRDAVAADLLPAEAPSLSGASLLVVDDDVESRDWLKALLSGMGAEVRDASSASEAVQEFHTRRPEVLVSDIEMEGGDGLALMRRIREIEEGDAPIPAIALTGRARAADRIQAMAAGFNLHLPKPVDPLELVVAIANLRALHPGRARQSGA